MKGRNLIGESIGKMIQKQSEWGTFVLKSSNFERNQVDK